MVSRPASRRHRGPPQGQRLNEGGREQFESVGHEERLRMSQFRTEYNRQALRASFPAWAGSPTSPRTRYSVPNKRQPPGPPRGGWSLGEYRILNIQSLNIGHWIFDCRSVRDRVAEVRGRIAPWGEALTAAPTTLFNAGAVCQAGMRRNDHFVTR